MRAMDTLLFLRQITDSKQPTLHGRDPIPSSIWLLSKVLRDTKHSKM